MPIKLSWFKLLWLNSDERAALKNAKGTQEAPIKIVETDSSNKPYKNVIYNPGMKVITVIFHSGAVIGKSSVSRETYLEVANAKTEKEIEDLLLDKIVALQTDVGVETVEERQMIKDNLSVFRNNADFEVIDNEVYLKPAKLPLPAIVAATFIEILEKRADFDDRMEERGGYATSEEWNELDMSYNTLKIFWLKLATNPLAQSREDTLLFVKINDIHLTRNGNMVLYRRIVTQGEKNKSLVKFVSQEYFRIKKWKKSPKKFEVGESDGEYLLYSGRRGKGIKKIGNLDKLYKNLPEMEENNYTSWNNKGDLTIKIGSIYQIPDKEINLDNGICAAGGLHAANVHYNYSSYGDTPVVVLVNPSKAITVPRGDMGKLRTTEMFIACVNDKAPGEHYDEGLDAFDEEYHDLTIKQLEDAVANKDYSTLRVKNAKPSVTPAEVIDILGALKGRVKQIV